MALDKVPAAMMSGLLVSETAPTNPGVGQRWYRASTAITYQYTNDGASSFWLDVSSGGIGTSAERGVDFVGDIDPIATSATVAGGLAVGSVYYNRETNRHFVCTTATDSANVWSGRYSGLGGTVTDYLLSGVYYRVHTFTTNGGFGVDGTNLFDILIVAGGAGGGGVEGGGGGGAGGFKYYSQKSLTDGSFHTVTIGTGGAGADTGTGGPGINSSFGALATAGGGGGGGHTAVGTAGGSGGGGGGRGDYAGGAGTTNQGNTGGVATDTPGQSGYDAGGGGGGAGAVGAASGGGTTGNPGDGGAGYTEGSATVYDWTLANGTTATFRINGTGNGYAGGGGGGTQINGQGSAATHGGGTSAYNTVVDGTANTGGGGGGGGYSTGAGDGGSGIIIVRYAI